MPLTAVGKWAVIYGAVVLEVASFTGVYYVWHNMNVNQEYRKKMYYNHPHVLETFYKSCTTVGIGNVKEKDLEAWPQNNSSEK